MPSDSAPFYHGTRAELQAGELIAPDSAGPGEEGETSYVYLSATLDEAIWDAELATSEGLSRVYVVEPMGPMEVARRSLGHPSMSCRSRQPFRVRGEVTQWRPYHGTRADLQLGDLIEPGHTPNFGNRARTTTYVYFTRTLDAAIWGAELAVGEGPGKIYVVEATGPIEDDPNLTNKKFRGNPTKAFRSTKPLRVTGEIRDWQGHSPDALKAMKAGIEGLERLGVEPNDD